MEIGFGTVQNNPVYVSKPGLIQYILKCAYIGLNCCKTTLDCWLQCNSSINILKWFNPRSDKDQRLHKGGCWIAKPQAEGSERTALQQPAAPPAYAAAEPALATFCCPSLTAAGSGAHRALWALTYLAAMAARTYI